MERLRESRQAESSSALMMLAEAQSREVQLRGENVDLAAQVRQLEQENRRLQAQLEDDQRRKGKKRAF